MDQEVSRYLAEMAALQEQILEELSDLQQEDFMLSTGQKRWNSVRRVMLRFGDHLREHTTQLIAAREDIGSKQTMPQRMLAQFQEAYGRWRGAMIGLTDEDLDKVPAEGEWTPRQILDHLAGSRYLQTIRTALENGEKRERD